jgi:hypothetical protein
MRFSLLCFGSRVSGGLLRDQALLLHTRDLVGEGVGVTVAVARE